jgi:hypothetical protein
MIDIKKIINAIDDELLRMGKDYLTPPEANLILAQKGLLGDRDDRNGLPLRKLLRKGKIPHAFQMGGKGSEWRIPSSSFINNNLSNYATIANPKIVKTSTGTNQEIQFDEVKKQIESARLKYRPGVIKYLLVAEAPPNSLDRFFYYENVKESDWLFLGVMQSLYPQDKNTYIQQKRKIDLKKNLLQKFKQDGFYLIDILDIPLSYYHGDLSDKINGLIYKIKSLSNKETQIILIKVNIYDTAFAVLRNQGFNVIDRRIDFPASGGQLKFQMKFKKALAEANYFNVNNE